MCACVRIFVRHPFLFMNTIFYFLLSSWMPGCSLFRSIMEGHGISNIYMQTETHITYVCVNIFKMCVCVCTHAMIHLPLTSRSDEMETMQKIIIQKNLVK